MSLRLRLVAVFGMVFVLAMALGALGLYGMGESNQGLKTVYEDRTVALDQISRIESLQLRIRMTVSLALLDGDTAHYGERADSVEKSLAEIRQQWHDYMATYLTETEKGLAGAYAADQERLASEAQMPALQALRKSDTESLKPLQEKLEQQGEVANRDLQKLRQLQVDVARQEYELAEQRFATLRIAETALIVLGGLLAAAAVYLLVTRIYRQLGGEPDYAAQIVRRIAEGDLTGKIIVHYDDQHSLLYAMQQMQARLAAAVGNIMASAETIAAATHQIAAGNGDLAARTEHQAGALEETAASISELASALKDNAASATQANALADQAAELARQGGGVVAQVVGTMASIDQSAAKIADIISLIDGIAFQTNILALNAAVEAARAGEQGRGFAVVATEVRNLAQRSAAAAKEIKGLIEASVATTQAGSVQAEQAGQKTQRIVAGVHALADILQAINRSVHNQSQEIVQIDQAVTELDNNTQQNTALVEESAAATASLSEQAGKLIEAIAHFRIERHAASTPRPVVHAMPRRRLEQYEERKALAS